MTDPTYDTESLHTPESRERDARLVGHEPKGETVTDDPKCEAGCISYYGGEKKHHRDCPYYSESLTKLNADRIEALLTERDALAEKLERAVGALKPFAIIAKHHAADAPEWRPFDSVSAQVSVMYLKDAATTLAAIKEKTDD